MAEIVPLEGYALLEPYLHSKALSDEVQGRSGLVIAPPENQKQSFEGVPCRGFIRCLPEDYDGELAIGEQVVFKDLRPKGFKMDGQKFLAVSISDITAKVTA